MKTAAMLCDVSVVTFSKIENASKGVRMDSILKVMSALGIRVEKLMFSSEEMMKISY